MKRQEHLLIILAEECAEVAQRASKALRFGLNEIEPGQLLTNHQRLCEEMSDLWAAADMLKLEGDRERAIAKKHKVEEFLVRSRILGTLDEPLPYCGVAPIGQLTAPPR